MRRCKRPGFLIFIGLFVFAILLAGGGYLYQVHQYQNQVKRLTYQEKELASIADGVYIGDCDVDFIYAKVEVTITDGKLSKIRLIEHRNDRGSKAEAITEEIIQQQRIDVDAVSGATNSSKVIKKAVENALEHAEKQESI